MPNRYSHVPNFTQYMEIVLGIANKGSGRQRILDIPAGNGLLAEKLAEYGHDVVCADINNEKEAYVYADMSETLPFNDGEFDTVICLEGVEHVIEPSKLISELCRICKDQGRIIISLPNIQNMFSRLQFISTGTYYQFPPSLPSQNIDNRKREDLGHISPLSFVQLRYLFKYYKADLIAVSGDKYKKKILLPLLLPFILLGYLWSHYLEKQDLAGNKTSNKHLFSPPLLFSRSLILVFTKNNTH